MARALRFQYPGAIYHVMARGDGGKTIFENKDDCEVFLHRLGEACGSCGWRVHAWVLMAKDGRGRRADVAWLEARAEEGEKIGDKSQAAMKHGWYLGEDTFKDQLLDLMEKLKGGTRTKPRKGTAENWRDHGERDAEDLISRYAPELDLPTGRKELEACARGMSARRCWLVCWPVKRL